jgi:DNA-binding PadR family transcriptional regulator
MPSASRLKILAYLVNNPKKQHYGAEISESTRLPHGTVYLILKKLKRDEWLHVRMEQEKPDTIGRPIRHLHSLTEYGLNEAKFELNEVYAEIAHHYEEAGNLEEFIQEIRDTQTPK